MPASPDERVIMGRIGAPYGVKGWVHFQPFSEMGDALADHAVWQIGHAGKWTDYTLEDLRPQGKSLVAKLAGIEDRDAAGALRGCEIAVPRSSLPPAGPDEYYWSDLIGLQVVNLQGAALGVVDHLLEAGAHDVLVVRGERLRMIPFTGGIIGEVDPAAGRIVADWQPDY